MTSMNPVRKSVLSFQGILSSLQIRGQQPFIMLSATLWILYIALLNRNATAKNNYSLMIIWKRLKMVKLFNDLRFGPPKNFHKAEYPLNFLSKSECASKFGRQRILKYRTGFSNLIAPAELCEILVDFDTEALQLKYITLDHDLC